MFDISNFIRLFGIIFSIGFIASSITGFIELSNSFVLSNLMLSLHALFMGLCLCCFEFKNDFCINYLGLSPDNVYKIRGIIYMWNGLLIIGISEVALGFGVFSSAYGLINVLIHIFGSSRDNTSYSDIRENRVESDPVEVSY